MPGQQLQFALAPPPPFFTSLWQRASTMSLPFAAAKDGNWPLPSAPAQAHRGASDADASASSLGAAPPAPWLSTPHGAPLARAARGSNGAPQPARSSGADDDLGLLPAPLWQQQQQHQAPDEGTHLAGGIDADVSLAPQPAEPSSLPGRRGRQ